MVALAGCGKHGTKKQGKPSEPEIPPMVVHSGPAKADRYVNTSEGKRIKAWQVTSESSSLTLDPKGVYGTMQTVKGEIYENDKVAATFTSESGEAEKETGILKLNGHVVVTGIDPKATVKGEHVEWDARIQIFKVIGNPSVDSSGIVMNSTDELWSTPKLTQVGTPDQFKK